MEIVKIVAPIVLILGVLSIVIASIVQSKNKAHAPSAEGSRFDGNFWQYLGWTLLSRLLTTVTFGIAYPWAKCMLLRWEVGHTVVNGRRLKFTGTGGKLFGKYILWAFLTIITCGIYSIWMSLRMKKWVVKHTTYADGNTTGISRFTGTVLGYFGIHILAAMLTVFTIGIGTPWAKRMLLQWEAKHTYICGTRLGFIGKGGQLFGKYLLWGLLTIVTFGIYGLFVPIRFLKWTWSHTGAVNSETPDEKKTPAWGVILIVLAILAAIAVVGTAVYYFFPEIASFLGSFSL